MRKFFYLNNGRYAEEHTSWQQQIIPTFKNAAWKEWSASGICPLALIIFNVRQHKLKTNSDTYLKSNHTSLMYGVELKQKQTKQQNTCSKLWVILNVFLIVSMIQLIIQHTLLVTIQLIHIQAAFTQEIPIIEDLCAQYKEVHLKCSPRFKTLLSLQAETLIHNSFTEVGRVPLMNHRIS